MTDKPTPPAVRLCLDDLYFDAGYNSRHYECCELPFGHEGKHRYEGTDDDGTAFTVEWGESK